MFTGRGETWLASESTCTRDPDAGEGETFGSSAPELTEANTQVGMVSVTRRSRGTPMAAWLRCASPHSPSSSWVALLQLVSATHAGEAPGGSPGGGGGGGVWGGRAGVRVGTHACVCVHAEAAGTARSRASGNGNQQ